jgi:hypothetical protein
MTKSVGATKQKVTRVDTSREPDEIRIVKLDNGKTFKFKTYYGEEDWRDVIARIIRNHYLD